MRGKQKDWSMVALPVCVVLFCALLFWVSKNTSDAGPSQTEPSQATGTPTAAETPPPAGSPRPTETPQPIETPQPWDPYSGENWNLLLVNPWNPLPESHTVTLIQLSRGHSVDERCYPDLQAMMDDCRAAGLSPIICSSYRKQETQVALFEKQVKKSLAKGYSREDAEVEAAKLVAVPGTSEHQLGLALDIVDLNNQNLNETQENTAVQKWLMEHSWEYGFILRYPNDKSEVTGILYEPWHYRYVGKDAAKEIHELGVCLEEYLVALGLGLENVYANLPVPSSAEGSGLSEPEAGT